MREGRANAQTKIRRENELEWQRIADLPEFGPAITATTQGPAPADAAEALTTEILARDYDLRIGSCLSRGSELVLAHFWPTVGVTALISIIVWATGVLPLIGSLLLTFVLLGGLDLYFLKHVRGQRTDVGDAFVGFGPRFVPLMLYSLVSQLLVMIGFVLCVIPGIYLLVIWTPFVGLLILDKGLDFWPAMEVSRKVINRHWWKMFGLLLVCFLLMLVGTLVCIVGLFITTPIATAAIVYAYEDIFGRTTVSDWQPLTQPPQPVPPTVPPPAGATA